MIVAFAAISGGCALLCILLSTIIEVVEIAMGKRFFSLKLFFAHLAIAFGLAMALGSMALFAMGFPA